MSPRIARSQPMSKQSRTKSTHWGIARLAGIGCAGVLAWAAVWVALADEPAEGKKPAELPPAAEFKVDFAKQIAPLLEKRRLGCHGAAKQQGGLRLDNAEDFA